MILEHFAASFLQNTATELQPNFRFLLLGYRNRAEKFAAIVRYYRYRSETQKCDISEVVMIILVVMGVMVVLAIKVIMVIRVVMVIRTDKSERTDWTYRSDI